MGKLYFLDDMRRSLSISQGSSHLCSVARSLCQRKLALQGAAGPDFMRIKLKHMLYIRPSPQAPSRVDSALPDSILMKIQRDLNGIRSFLDSDFAHLYGMLADQWSGRSEVDAYQACFRLPNEINLKTDWCLIGRDRFRQRFTTSPCSSDRSYLLHSTLN
jgi:hypothetical protein